VQVGGNTVKNYNVEAEWHMLLKNGSHRVKAMVLDSDLGIYINGMVVFPPGVRNHTDWTVYTPKAGNARIVEFNKKESKLWPEIEEVCIDAVKEHLRHEQLDSTDDMAGYENKSTEEFNKQLMDDLKKAGF
jgi:hypothetical protein